MLACTSLVHVARSTSLPVRMPFSWRDLEKTKGVEEKRVMGVSESGRIAKSVNNMTNRGFGFAVHGGEWRVKGGDGRG